MKFLGLWSTLGGRMERSPVPRPAEGGGEGGPPPLLLLLLLLLLLPSLIPAAAAGSTEVAGKIDLDLAPGAFDDQYLGCGQQVMELLNQGDYFTREVDAHRNYSRLWHRAHLEWLGHARAAPHGLSATHAVALGVYASDVQVRSELARAMGRATSSRQYQRAFHFKFLHYYLTSAVQLLRLGGVSQEDAAPCHRVRLALEDGALEAQVGTTLRFGQFLLATPLREEEARMPGTRQTLLTLVTCLGAPIHAFSPGEAVLVPPYEVFVVVNRSHQAHGDWWHLRSVGNRSAYNCQLLKASGHRPAPSTLLLASLSGLVGLQSLFQNLGGRPRCCCS